MQFNIPQFIEIEDKIFGPFTFKQFAYIVGAAGASFFFYSLLPFPVALLLILGVGTLAFLLGFKPVGGRPFATTLEASLRYFFGSKLYLWKKERKKDTKIQKTTVKSLSKSSPSIPRVVEGKLDNLSWSLDVKSKDENKQ